MVVVVMMNGFIILTLKGILKLRDMCSINYLSICISIIYLFIFYPFLCVLFGGVS